MKVNGELQGVAETMQSFDKLINDNEKAITEVLEYVLRKMANDAKQRGNYQDRTGNLRNSISINMNTEVYDANINPSVLKGKVAQLKNPVVKIEDNEYTGAISANMEYAIFVELTSGYTVLQGTIDKFESLIKIYLADHLRVSRW